MRIVYLILLPLSGGLNFRSGPKGVKHSRGLIEMLQSCKVRMHDARVNFFFGMINSSAGEACWDFRFNIESIHLEGRIS